MTNKITWSEIREYIIFRNVSDDNDASNNEISSIVNFLDATFGDTLEITSSGYTDPSVPYLYDGYIMRYRYEYFKHIDEMCSHYENILLEYFIYRYDKGILAVIRF